MLNHVLGIQRMRLQRRLVILYYLFLCQIIILTNKILYLKQKTKFKQGLVIFNVFLVVFTASSFVGNPVLKNMLNSMRGS